MDSKIQSHLKNSTRTLLIELIIIFRNSFGLLCSYKRFYLIRYELSIHSFYAKIKFDLKLLIHNDIDSVSFFFKGIPMSWSSNIFQYGPSNSLRIYCLIFSDANQFNTRSIQETVREDPLLGNNIFEYIIENIPQFRDFLDFHPEIQSSLSSNDTNDIFNQLINNPARIHDIMMRHDQELRNIESLPGGYSALERLYLDIQEPLQNVFEGIIPSEYGDHESNLNSDIQNIQIAENRRPLGNPWEPNVPNDQNSNLFPNGQNSEFVNFYSQMFNNRSTQVTPYTNMQHRLLHNSRSQLQTRQQPFRNFTDMHNIDRLEERYSIQIELLLNMGFTDRNKILEALFISNGDIDLALSILLTH